MLTIQFAAVLFTAALISAFARRPSVAADRGVLPLHFAIDFGALLLFGIDAALVVAVVGIAAQWVSAPARIPPLRRSLLNAVAVLTALGTAGVVESAANTVVPAIAWPFREVSVAAAAVAYCAVKTAFGEIIVPLALRHRVNRSWLAAVVRHVPSYVIAATAAVALVELLQQAMWTWLAVSAIPLYCAYRAYGAGLDRIEDESRRQEVIGSLNQGMSVIDPRGHVLVWNDALERILECPRERAIGRSLVGAVPALGRTPLPKVLQEALSGQSPRTLSACTVTVASQTRILDIQALPVTEGVAVLWHDNTDKAEHDQTLKRNYERLTAAVEGANDGLWEWDLRTKVFSVSGRWKTIVGLPATADIGRPEDWLGRVHPDDAGPLNEALDAHVAGRTDCLQHEHRLRHEDGTYRRFLCRGLAVRGAGQKAIRIAGSLSDTTAQSLAKEQLRSAGYRDPLTGLCNRSVFVERLGRRLEEFKNHTSGESFAVLYLDLDRFKVVNDSLGHWVGDDLLTAVSRRLESCLRPEDTLARLGGDEFAILLNAIGDAPQANAVAFRIQNVFSGPFAIGGREVFTSASIGIALGFTHYGSPDEIMRDADTAMYHAKSRGKARHELFDSDMHERTRDRLGLEIDLRHAVEHHDFEVHYQPIVLLESRRCVGFESLIRWTRNGQPVSPAIFIPIAEELGLIDTIGTRVLQEVCHTFAEWKRHYAASRIDYVTVNVSSRQLLQQNFLMVVEDAVTAAGLKPCDLRLEITETALMDNPTAAAKLLSELRDFGVKIYLDDFGTGYSSLSHLHKLPVDALKIDRSFVRSLSISDRPAIVESILALARTLNTSVVAEGIEDEEQADELERLGCTHAQGYLFSRPLSTEKAEDVLAADRPLGPARVERYEAPAASDFFDRTESLTH